MSGLTEEDSVACFHYYNKKGWVDKDGNIITDPRSTLINWRINKPRFEKSDKNNRKAKLFPIKGKTCGKTGCPLPAVYKDGSGSYDSYFCAEHMPKSVKELYH